MAKNAHWDIYWAVIQTTIYMSEDDFMDLLLEHAGGPMTAEEYNEACQETQSPHDLSSDIFHRAAYVATRRNLCGAHFAWEENAHFYSATFPSKRTASAFRRRFSLGKPHG